MKIQKAHKAIPAIQRTYYAKYQETETDMRFTSSTRPALTPLGHRLLHLSESKLAYLEPGVGGRDSASAMWKGVIVREAVKSAWKSVDQGSGDLTDWSSKSAMGLDIIGEDEEEEDEEEEEEGRWFEDLVSSFGEDDFEHDAAWTSSAPSYDESARSFSFTSPRSSPIEFGVVSADLILSSDEAEVEVGVVEVNDESEYDYQDPVLQVKSLNFAADVDAPLTGDTKHAHLVSDMKSLYLSLPAQPLQPILMPHAHPIAPVPTSLTPISPFTLNDVLLGDDLDQMSDSFLLPPPLVRSFSSVSTSSLQDDECVTPPAEDCRELAEDDEDDYDEEMQEAEYEDGYAMTKRLMAGGWLGLSLNDRSPVLLA